MAEERVPHATEEKAKPGVKEFGCAWDVLLHDLDMTAGGLEETSAANRNSSVSCQNCRMENRVLLYVFET